MNTLKIGYAREAFSPDRPVQMNYRLTGTYVREPICVTALFLQDTHTRVLVMGLDLRNTYKSFTSTVMPMITEATGIPAEDVIFASTHNHSCPEAMAYQDDAIRDWGDRIAFPAIVRAAVNAVADAKSVRCIYGGKANTEKLNFVRRYMLEDGSWKSVVSANPSKAPVVAHENEADPEVRAVRVEREGGRDLVLVNYQMHAAGALDQFPDAVNADFVGAMRDKLEKEHDIHVLYLQGACGNINYATKIDEEKPFLKEHYWQVGEALADTVLAALSEGRELKCGKLQLCRGMLDCVVNHDKDHLAPVAQQITDEPDADKQAEMMRQAGIVNRFERKAIIRRAGMPQTQPVELASVSFGDVAFAFAPFEMFDTNGIQLRRASPFAMTFSCGYALSCFGYLPSQQAFPHGEYEALICRFIPGTGESVVLELCAQLQSMRNETEQ